MRYFLGFDLPANSKMAIGEWRSKAMPDFTSPVPIQNFHITAEFLGHVENNQMANLLEQISGLELASFDFRLNMLGFWSKPRILWLGSSDVPTDLISNQKKIFSACRRANLQLSDREYRPHCTLVRKVKQNPPAPLIAPDFPITVNALHLFESVSGRSGVHYPIRHSWEMLG